MKTGRLGFGDFLPKLGRSEGVFRVVEVVVLVALARLLPNRLYRLLLTSALLVVVVVVDAVELPG